MAAAGWSSQLLVKARPGPAAVALRLDDRTLSFQAEPLFASIEQPEPGFQPASQWQVLTAPPGLDEANPWDLCHAVLQGGLGVDGGALAVEFAEPDLQQRWLTGEEARQALALARACVADEQDPAFPTHPDPLWFRNDEFSQFDAALGEVGGPGARSRVRIAHIDTGYDPQHRTLPARLRLDLQRNFADRGRPNDASDTSGGLFANLGHGTGTLSILAGQAAVHGKPPIGAAPFAEVVPVRVADRVVLFSSSAIARAFDYVHALSRDRRTAVDVVTMSMGGVASRAWAEAINALYEQGVFVVTAAGNNYGNLPTRNIVFPARFARVVAACGVMADHSPYADLGLRRMAGNYGPPSKMETAIAACTPNMIWAKIGCPGIVGHDGAGTSSATPQVAAAAALWIQKNRAAYDAYAQSWMRVEAVRHALFAGSRPNPAESRRLGRGELAARAALAQAPAAPELLRQTARDSASFPVLRILTGLGLQAVPDARQQMLELEALQLSQSAEIEAVLPDPDVPAEALSPAELARLAEALAAQPGCSQALRDTLWALRREERPAVPVEPSDPVSRLHLRKALEPPLPAPTRRRLRVYAYDPALASRLETAAINQARLDVAWEEDLRPGPVGEYLEIIDLDPPSHCCYAPIDLNHPHLLVQEGLAPTESNPQFHQQMAYAVAMKTIEHFERALGRAALWAPRRVTGPDGKPDDVFVRRLRIYPHALRAENAYYSPDRKALLFGYFSASRKDVGDVLPGGLVFTVLSHDIIAHETCHALLDGLHRRYIEPTNPDVLAFHEAFADIVALFQHFTIPEALRHQIAETRGDLTRENLLAKLAVQFGQATGRGYGGLRNAVRRAPQRDDYERAKGEHDRGAVLVAAVFDAFNRIYRARAEDLVRLATSGTGILPEGNLPEILVDRLAREASKVAGQVLTICIRALDYCPPVDITFGEYLRALITADTDLVPDDDRGYRVAFITGFRERGIYPSGVKHLSPGSLVWEPPPLPLDNVETILDRMDLSWDLDVDRGTAFEISRRNAATMHGWLMSDDDVSDAEVAALGLDRHHGPRTFGGVMGTLGPVEVHSVRPARRIGPDGQHRADLVVELTQTFRPDPPSSQRHRGGCTLLINLEERNVRYLIRKRVGHPDRMKAQAGFAMQRQDDLRASYFDRPYRGAEAFALLHRPH